MLKIISFFILALFLLACNNQHGTHDHNGSIAKDSTFQNAVVIAPSESDTTVIDTLKKSLPAIATGNINGRKLVIRYHSPAVRKRAIWGGLVAFDQVWVTGAHS